MKKSQTVWVIMHYEFMGDPDKPWPDALQFHVSTSRARAEKYIRTRGVDSHSWWQIYPYKVDDTDGAEGEEVYYYSYRGTPLKSPPYKRALAAYKKHVARNPDIYPENNQEQGSIG